MDTKSIVIILLTWAHAIHAHSWVECVSYDPLSFESSSLGDYERGRCSGYPRNFKRQFSEGFGVDTGYNWGHADCLRDPFKSEDYTSDIPMAKYKAGQTIYISHPAKNHVADTCTNPFIPSTSFVVKMSSQPNVDTFDVSLPMFGPEHVNGQIDHLGYQRCFNFCGDADKSHCLSAWTLPSNIPDGRYSFIWIWEFNVGEIYANCFDAYISANGDISMNTTTPAFTPANTTPTPESTFPSAPVPTSTSSPSPPTSPPPTPAITPNATSSTPRDTPTITPSPTTARSSPAPTDPPQVITSTAATTGAGPLVNLGSYLMNITGLINFEGFLNTTISNIVNVRRLL